MKKRQKRVLTRAEVIAWLQRRHWVRLHMFFLVTATFLAGLLATKLLMELGVDTLWLRYALAVCGAYLVFLVLVRLWIWYVCGRGVDLDAADGIDLFVRAMDKGERVEIGGGEFGGGGASGTWDTPDGVPVDVEISTAPAKLASTGGSDKSGCLSFDIGGDEGCFVVILLAVLVGALLIAGGYLIYAAPAILGEAVFEVLLAAALARRAKKLEAAGWGGSVFNATVWIFLAVLAIAVTLGWYAQKSCPEATRIRDAINCGSTR
ncbi:MAG TPA: hypothetical protein VGQ76_00235 [Thermoanaerobaculia bacterium]|nr:hypothetical protein [Thermoanaerobaculia bacterium]